MTRSAAGEHPSNATKNARTIHSVIRALRWPQQRLAALRSGNDGVATGDDGTQRFAGILSRNKTVIDVELKQLLRADVQPGADIVECSHLGGDGLSGLNDAATRNFLPALCDAARLVDAYTEVHLRHQLLRGEDDLHHSLVPLRLHDGELCERRAEELRVHLARQPKTEQLDRQHADAKGVQIGRERRRALGADERLLAEEAVHPAT
mmetsp:Transcript_11867/g.27452  ORF Transcript_11867/g.27452 Transcript_11867/m.27452 type:complete len:207 (-) Transcript_11867:1387-2007(-)